MSITAISFYWRNDTPSFMICRSRLATPDRSSPTCIVIHGGQFTGGVHLPNQFVPEIVSPLPCMPALVRHTLLIVYFFKELISFIGSLYKCHTSVFNALIFNCGIPYLITEMVSDILDQPVHLREVWTHISHNNIYNCFLKKIFI